MEPEKKDEGNGYLHKVTLVIQHEEHNSVVAKHTSERWFQTEEEARLATLRSIDGIAEPNGDLLEKLVESTVGLDSALARDPLGTELDPGRIATVERRQ